jgi:hypothetical protein
VSAYIRKKDGVPVASDFAAADGTPIVIDVLTRIAYYYHDGDVFPIQGLTTSSTNAFSDGFDDGFS